jgi:hypothetical protein
MGITIENSVDKSNMRLVAEIEKQLDPENTKSIISETLREIAKEYAEQWLIDNLQEVYSYINAEAIANMLLVEVAKQVKNDITSKENK